MSVRRTLPPIAAVAACLALAGCYGSAAPVIAKGERLPFEGPVTCTVEGASGPPTVRTFDAAKAETAADGSVSYADGESRLTVRRAPGGLWLAQYGKPGRYDLGYLLVQGSEAKILGLASFATSEESMRAARVRPAVAANGQTTQLLGDPRDIEAFMLARQPDDMFATGTCRAGKAAAPDAPLVEGYRRSTTRAQALARPGAIACEDGKVCARRTLAAMSVSTVATFGKDDVLRELRVTAGPPAGPADSTAPVEMGIGPANDMKPVGAILDETVIQIVNPASITPAMGARWEKVMKGDGGMVGAVSRGEVRELFLAFVDPATRLSVGPTRFFGDYLVNARKAGGLTLEVSMTAKAGAPTIVTTWKQGS